MGCRAKQSALQILGISFVKLLIEHSFIAWVSLPATVTIRNPGHVMHACGTCRANWEVLKFRSEI